MWEELVLAQSLGYPMTVGSSYNLHKDAKDFKLIEQFMDFNSEGEAFQKGYIYESAKQNYYRIVKVVKLEDGEEQVV